MTITGFIVRNTFRNKRRSLLTVPAPWWMRVSQKIRLEGRRSHHVAGNYLSREPGAYDSRHLHYDACQQDFLFQCEISGRGRVMVQGTDWLLLHPSRLPRGHRA